MHGDNVKTLCASAFVEKVNELFDEAEERAKPELARGKTNVVAPVTGDIYDSWYSERCEEAKRKACAALAARARFKKDHPTWPELPVSEDELRQLQRGLSQRGWWRTEAAPQIIFLMFALSLRYHLWPAEHPGFRDFARSVLADERTKHTIRNNDELKKEFPPAPIVELFRATDSPSSLDFLHWFSPKRVTGEKKARQAFARARAAGASIEEAQNAFFRILHAELPQ